MIDQLQALFDKEHPNCKNEEMKKKWKELGRIEIRKLIIKHALKVDYTQPIDAYGQHGTCVNIFRRWCSIGN